MKSDRLKKLFSRQTLLAVFLFLFIGAMCVSTLNRVFVIDRNVVDKKYSIYLDSGNSKPVAIAKTCANVLTNIDDFIIGKSYFLNIFGLTEKLSGTRYIANPNDNYSDIIKLDNGSLVFSGGDYDTIGETAAENMTKLKSILDEKNIGLLYVIAPYKTDPTNSGLPDGVKDKQNIKAQSVYESLTDAGIDTLSLINEIQTQGLDHSSLFFRTDQNWKPSAALWAARTVSSYLNDNYGYGIDLSLLDDKSFTTKVYEDYMLGNIGKKVGSAYAGVDDFELITPNYDTDITYWYLKKNGSSKTKNGAFEDTLIFRDCLKHDYFGTNAYTAYSGGDYLKTCATNHNNTSGKKILLVRDSSACTFAPFFSLAACEQLYTVDLRIYKGSLLEYINAVNPDTVIYLEYPYFNQVKHAID